MIFCSMSAVTARMIDGKPLRSANDRSRWCTVWSLVERGTYQIDEIRQKRGWDTIDLVRHEGHFYSTKPPLLPRMVAEVYRIVKWSTGWTLDAQTASTTQLILFVVNIIPAGIALWVLCSLIHRYCENTFGRWFLIAGACWATLMLPFLTVFNNHTIATTSIIFAIALAISITVEDRHTPWRFVLCGFFAAFGCCNELPAAVFGLLIFFTVLRARPRRTWTWFVPGALIPLIAFFVTNFHATGGWKPFYMYYGTEKYLFVHEGIPSYWMDPKGVDKGHESLGTYFLHCTIGHHGIYSLTPIFLLTWFGWLMPRSCWKSSLRIYYGMGLLLTIYVVAFLMSRTENYNYGGVSVGLRRTLWLTPFWVLAMIPVMNRCGRSSIVRAASLLCLAVSIFSAWYPTGAPWTQPWLYRVAEHYKWIDYSDPRPQFDGKRYTWIGSFPAGKINPDYWIEFESLETSGAKQTLRLSDAGEAPEDSSHVIALHTKGAHPAGPEASESRTFHVDVTAFRDSQPVDTFLVSPAPSDPQREMIVRFLQGVPKKRLYASSRIRYVKTALRPDAFRCHVGYTYVELEQSGRTVQYLRDVWYCDEVPFGVLQWEDRVLDKQTKAILSQQSWRPTGCGMFRPSGD